ncbi:COPII coat assembly protein sec-16 [Leucoagaricus sp. SymC.cos]|nr:COPII coat assembly protein sec-16 [Leucoagaricus sp. SymC.cos]
MSGTEAAASLFGSADSSSDPFATLGTDFSQETSDNLFGGANANYSAQPDAADIFKNPADQPEASSGSPETTNSPPAVQGYGHTSNPYTPAHNASAPLNGQGPYETHQQRDGNHTSHSGAPPMQNSYDANKYAPPTVHDPYAPPHTTTYAPSTHYQPPASQPTTHSHPGNQSFAYDNRSAADPYVPPQPANQSAYVPQYNTGHYAPNVSGTSSTPAYQTPYAAPQVSSYTSPPPPPKANLATVPQPPAPTTTQVTRPKVSNAYDPPFLATSYTSANAAPPSPRPPPKTHDDAPVYAPTTHTSPAALPAPPPPSQYQSTSQSAASHMMINSYVPVTYTASIPPSSMSAPSSVESQNKWTPAKDSHDQPTKEQTPPFPGTGSGADFFDKVDQQASRGNAEEQASELQSPDDAASSLQAVVSPEVKPISAQSPNSLVSSSPQKPLQALSPPRTSQESGRISSPRQSPRPPSTSSPVYGISHPPRASPDLRRESLVRSEQIPRARTTSPGVDGATTVTSPYTLPPKGPALRSKSTSITTSDRVSSPESSPNAAHERYAPRGAKVSNVYGIERVGSPSSFSTRSSDSQPSIKPQIPSYLPPVSESSYTSIALTQEPTSMIEDPYAPSQYNRTIKPSPSFGSYGQSPYSYSTELSPQETTVKPTIGPYAPSPSLLGANDSLNRTSVRVPVVSFGFGGKLVTCFHDEGPLNTGFDVALSSRTSTKIQIRNWKKLVPESALDSTGIFPGPLHADPGAPSAGIMKATATTQAKTKKTQLLNYLIDRVDEITQGLGYLHSGSAEKRTAEGKLVLVKLLKIMVENDGRLTGTSHLDSAVRVALVPKLEGLVSGNDTGTNFTTTADTAGLLADGSYGSLANTSDAAPITVTTLRVAALDKIETFLLRKKKRRQAYHYALDEKLWAHAMVIASSIDKEAWKEVVSEFIRADLGVKGDGAFTLPGRTDSQALPTNGREGLRMAYSLFSGQGAGAVQELVPKNMLARGNSRLPIPAPTIPAPTLGQPTPVIPNFSLPAAGTKIPTESLAKWAETVAMMLVSPLTPDASAALTALGDQLMANGWLEAAHACYMLSPQTSPVGGVGNPAARIVLLGSKNPATMPIFSKDPDSILFTEIMEHAFATAPVPKGQEPNHGFPHLQAYRLIRAYAAAEAGDLGIASRYCEAITASLVRVSVYFTPTLLEQLKGLADRLSGVSHSDKTNSWMAGKISKPSLDTIGGWLEGRFTKLVTGDTDSPASPQEESGKQDGHSFAGPFAHYNTISSTTSSARSSPAPSFVTPAYALPPRTGSAMSNKTPYCYGVDRSSSAMDPIRRKNSPGLAAPPPPPQAMSAGPAITSFPSIQTQLGNYNNGTSNYSNGYSPGSDLQTPKPSLNHEEGDESNVQEVTWWGSSGYGSNDNGKTPTVAHFEKVEDTHGGVDNNGFFSPMMNQKFMVGPQSTSPASGHRQYSYEEDDEDDLGLGNNSNKTKEQTSESNGPQDTKPVAAAATSAPAQEKKPDTPTQSSGWFSRWWGRKDNTSGGPIKASLGEESSFYYDKELKRWVNKKAGAETPKAAVPPPPPRAQTASPAMTGPKPGGGPPSRPPSGPPGPPSNGANGHALGRPASAIDLTTSPPTSKPIMRVRSNLAPPGVDSAPPTPTGTRLAPGPAGAATGGPPTRPKSSTSQKRNVRSRYVDVFAQEGGGSGA